jgi:hypothetical protein
VLRENLTEGTLDKVIEYMYQQGEVDKDNSKKENSASL